MSYISNTKKQQKQMLSTIGVDSINDLFKDIPQKFRNISLNIPDGTSEYDVKKHLKELSQKNNTHLTCFLGGGFYDHYIPSAVKALTSRSEFYTSYTPYQPEISQGTLQSIFEYQSAICTLTGMDVSNASLYYGGTGLYEAIMMCVRITKRNKVVIDEGVSPIYRKMIKTNITNLDLDFKEIPLGKNGIADRKMLNEQMNDQTACLVLQNPNFFGCIDDLTDLIKKAHKQGIMVVLSTYPISLGLLKTPGEMDADIVTGEGQSLGLPLSFGGPYLGFIAAKSKYIRQMPGRIVGETTDKKGQRGFVLTLQAREQHIRRDKAFSNICSNQALCALSAIIYMSLIGKQGLKDIATVSHRKAVHCYNRLLQIPGVKPAFTAPFFNEFTLELPAEAGDVISKLIEQGIIAGFPLSRYYKNMDKKILIAVTEKRTKKEIGILAEQLESVL
jgi:glycine dehydrogenase subunit 1